jgi:hypothetical protein
MAADGPGRFVPVTSGGDEESGAAPLDWLLEMLQQTITEVLSGDGTPLQKGNAVARLANLYLKARGTEELKRKNRDLTLKIEELAERLNDLEGSSEGTPAGSAGGEKTRPSERRPQTRTRPLRSLARPTRRSARLDPARSSVPPTPDLNLSLNEADEIQITVPPGTNDGDSSP